MENASLRSNIWKLGILQALRWFLLFMPVVVLFYQENGLSMREVMVLQALYSLSIVLFEIPSGYLSDALGRRTALVTGTALGACGFFIYSVSGTFWGFLCAEICLGLGQSFISGTDAAVLYDTLIEMGNEESFTRRQGRMLAVGNFSEAVAGITGGFIALISLRMNFVVETGIMIAAIPVAWSIQEPRIHKLLHAQMNWKGFITVMLETFQTPHLRWLIVYSSILGASTLTAAWFVQPYLKLIGIPLVLFGIIWTVLHVSLGFVSMIAHRVETFIGRRLTFIVPLVGIFAGYVLVGSCSAMWASVFLLLFYFVRGFILPVCISYINRHVTTDRRATVLSIRALLTRLIFSVVGPLAGWVSDSISLQHALILSGSIFFVLGMISLGALFRYE